MGSLLLAGSAGGEPHEGLTWDAPDGCPGRDHVAAELERRLGRAPGAGLPAGVAVEARVLARQGEAWRVRIRTKTARGSGEREVAADSCSALADVAVLVISLAIESEPLPPPLSPPPPPPPLPPPPARWRFAARVGLGVGGGVFPQASAAAGLALGAHRDRLRVEIGAAHFFPSATESPAFPGVTLDFALDVIAVRGCYAVFGPRALEIDACAGTEGGRFEAQAAGTVTPQSGRTLWIALAAGPAIAWSLTGVIALWAEAGLALPLSRPRFRVEGLGEVHRPDAAGARAMAGIEIHTP